nr:cytochrome b6/f complex subunit VI [Juncus himalensis]ULQ66935.1 cytochrome b6/f complex subunit VI [Juncus himalensis]
MFTITSYFSFLLAAFTLTLVLFFILKKIRLI